MPNIRLAIVTCDDPPEMIEVPKVDGDSENWDFIRAGDGVFVKDRSRITAVFVPGTGIEGWHDDDPELSERFYAVAEDATLESLPYVVIAFLIDEDRDVLIDLAHECHMLAQFACEEDEYDPDAFQPWCEALADAAPCGVLIPMQGESKEFDFAWECAVQELRTLVSLGLPR